MPKAKPISIKVNRGEGPIHECNKPKTVRTFQEANRILANWAISAPSTGGYDKCDFTVTYDNEDTYTGRIDIVRDDFMRSNLLEKHMTETALFYSGQRRPAHMSEADYERFLGFDHVQEPRKQYAEFLATCQIGDEPSQTFRLGV